MGTLNYITYNCSSIRVVWVKLCVRVPQRSRLQCVLKLWTDLDEIFWMDGTRKKLWEWSVSFVFRIRIEMITGSSVLGVAFSLFEIGTVLLSDSEMYLSVVIQCVLLLNHADSLCAPFLVSSRRTRWTTDRDSSVWSRLKSVRYRDGTEVNGR